MAEHSKTPTLVAAGSPRAVACDVLVTGLHAGRHGWLAAEAARALALLDARGEVRIRIVDDAEMAAAHLEYCEIPGTTDVLTFDMSETQGTLDTDILACLDEATRQAAIRGHSIDRELLLYIIHGCLHCLGHDDHDEAAAARMHAEEDRLLEAIGIGRTFATEGNR